eukprot:gene13691-biopygen3532
MSNTGCCTCTDMERTSEATQCTWSRASPAGKRGQTARALHTFCCQCFSRASGAAGVRPGKVVKGEGVHLDCAAEHGVAWCCKDTNGWDMRASRRDASLGEPPPPSH